MRLMNDLRYGQLSNPNWSLKLVLIHVGNHQELLFRYFHYTGQGFYCISFLESIFLNTERTQTHLDHTIIFDELILYLIYDVLELSWLGIHKS